MTRRNLVALVAASILAFVGILLVSAILLITRTDLGREELRRRVVQPIASRSVVHGGASVYIGHLGGNFITEFTIDTFAIRDKRGELFLSTGPVRVDLDPRDLFDRRIFIHQASVAHPYIHIVQHENFAWNFNEILGSGINGPPKDPRLRNFGDYVVIDSLRATAVTFLLTQPWHPDDTLRGPARDSVIRAHLSDPAKGVARTFDGYGITRAWRNGHGLLVHARLADPDSDRKFGQQFVVDSVSTDVYEPTFKFRNVVGQARHLGDSIWFEVPHFDMPASTGHGQGKVWWGSDLPVRYDVAVHGDSVSLDDVNWVYPNLPRTGGGTLDLSIRNEPAPRMQIVDFKLSKLDVRSTKSHLTGDMTFGIGAPLLIVRNVDLKAEPVDFDLLRTLNGKAFGLDWQGQLSGTVRARGGPLNHFYVDDGRVTFNDAHVPGAVSRVAGKGELDILYPAFTAFHGFNVDAASVDLRTIEYLEHSFPHIHGFISGTATLDSSWLDVRFSNAHIAHQDGPGEPSRLSGAGRITDAEPYMIYDVRLNAEPLSLTMLARSYPGSPLRGLVSGPVVAKGSAPDLELSTTLQGASGGFSFNGHLAFDSVGLRGARGDGQFSGVNLAALLEMPSLRAGSLSGHYDVDVNGEPAAALQGAADVDLARTSYDSVTVYPTRIGVRFGGGQMTVDSVRLRTTAATMNVTGGIGLPNGRPDSLHIKIDVDSLGGLRRYLSHPDTTLLGSAATLPDSISGTLKLDALASGTMDSLSLSGHLSGDDIYVRKDRGNHLDARFDLHDVPRRPSGTLQARIDTVTYFGIALDTIGARFDLSDATHALFRGGALSRNGPVLSLAGAWARTNDADAVTVDSLDLAVGQDTWRLTRPSHLTIDSAAVRLDSLVLHNRDSAAVVAAANVPATGPAEAMLRASALPLRDIGIIAQLSDSVRGSADLSIAVSGSKDRPHIAATAALAQISLRGVDIDQARANTVYDDGRLNTDVDVIRAGRRAIAGTASIPATITLFGFKQRDDTISGHLDADTTDLAIVKTLIPGAGKDLQVAGRLAAHVQASGSWLAPVFEGGVSVANGSVFVPAAGVTIGEINGAVTGTRNATRQDSINVTLRATTAGKPAGRATLEGWTKNLFGRAASGGTLDLTLTASNFHAFDKSTIADLYFSDSVPLRLSGTTRAPVLTGALRVDRGSIFLADRDLARKQLISGDTALVTRSADSVVMLTTFMNNLQINDVPITVGDVRLRSAEANVKLTGALHLVTANAATRTVGSSQLAQNIEVIGTLTTAGGTYNLNLGPVQRVFTVLPDGTVTFDGSAENPVLDIRAEHDVQRQGEGPLGVIVNLHGRLLPYPQIGFASNAGYDIATSDLLSYLLIGRPGFDFGANAGTTQVLANVLGPTIDALTAEKLRQSGFGGAFDVLHIQLGSVNTQGTNAGFSSAIYGATIGAEKSFGRNVYLNLNAGFCQLQTLQSTGTFNALNSLGAQVAYRPDPKLSLTVAWDPPTQGRVCTPQQVIGFIQTPGKLSFSLGLAWRF